MSKKIKEAFNELHADPVLIEKTKKIIIQEKKPVVSFFQWKYVLVPSLVLLITISLWAGYPHLRSTPSEQAEGNSYFTILNKPPEEIPQGLMDYQPLTQDQIFDFASIIVHAEITGFKWVRLENEREFFRYRTIVTAKVLNSYKGDAVIGHEIEILLPVAIPGYGGDDGVWIEDNMTVQSLKKGMNAFFFAKEFDDQDYVGETQNRFPARDICKYGTQWGEEYILPEYNGTYTYFSDTFTSLKHLDNRASFEEIESIIAQHIQ
ncbi:UNVERIFIED_CONTAM: hypothetical protein Cloal_1822 [Acetivibrio alkalicellulosi]